MPEQARIPAITIGCDPEFFIRDKKTRKIVSAHNLLPGTKEAPFSVPGGAVQVDGIAAEINITPAGDCGHFSHYMDTVEKELRKLLGDKYDLVKVPVTLIDKEDWVPIPESAKVLGCNPDFNAWTGSVNDPPPDSDEFPKMRTAAGHVHIGWTKGKDVNDVTHFQDCCIVAKQMDYFLGLFTVLWDPDNRRRSMYGKAGAFRPKPYGVEYRVPSNVWTRDARIQQWVWNTSYSAIASVFRGNILEEDYGDYAQRMINENNLNWLSSRDGKHIAKLIGVGLPPIDQNLLYPGTAEIKESVGDLKKMAQTWSMFIREE